MTDRERAAAFLRETYRRRVDRVEEHEWGELVLTPSLPLVYDANFAIVDRWDGTAAALRREVERVQRQHRFAHRKSVIPAVELAGRLWPEIVRQGWVFASRYLVLASRREADRPPDPGIEIVEVGPVDWARGRRRMLALEGHGSDPELVRQLIALDERLGAAMEVHHVAATVDGEVAAYAGLYVDGPTAQIEDVATLPEHRGRGLARAVVLHARDVARRGGAELVFLVADEGDWPKELYGRLGFDAIGVEHIFGRPSGHDQRG